MARTVLYNNTIEKLQILVLCIFVVCLCLSAGTSAECRMRRVVHTVAYQDCLPKRMLSFACQGSCPSYTQASLTRLSMLERSCQCCQERKSVVRRVNVMCPDTNGPKPFRRVLMRLALPRGCMCRPCRATIEGIEPQEFSDLGSKRNRILPLFGLKP